MLVILAACDSATGPTGAVTESASVDDQIQTQVESAIANASDLPSGLSIDVTNGVVSISGSVACEDCPGLRTPANVGTIQQTLGAIVRAIPGVTRVDFDLDYGSD
jgi:osmotically-inducible protein OsmY